MIHLLCRSRSWQIEGAQQRRPKNTDRSNCQHKKIGKDHLLQEVFFTLLRKNGGPSQDLLPF